MDKRVERHLELGTRAYEGAADSLASACLLPVVFITFDPLKLERDEAWRLLIVLIVGAAVEVTSNRVLSRYLIYLLRFTAS